jgi:hypothetical protein
VHVRVGVVVASLYLSDAEKVTWLVHAH